MSGKVTVLDLLEEMEEIVDTSTENLITGRISVDPDELSDLIDKVRECLPDDVMQAKWLMEEKDSIMAEAEQAYKRILTEARKEADSLVKEHVIVRRAEHVASEIYRAADEYSENLTLKTYDYMDKILFKFAEQMRDLNESTTGALIDHINGFYNEVNATVENDRIQIHGMAKEVHERDLPVHEINTDYDE